MKTLLKNLFVRLPGPVQMGLASRYLSRKRRRLTQRSAPDALTFFVTKRCNCRCAHCFYWQALNEPERELGIAEVRRVAASLRPLRSVSLTGGEPTLRKDLAEVGQAFVEEAGTRDVGLATNGLLRKRVIGLCERILAAGAEHVEVQVSLDGLAGTHDRIRRVPGAYDKALATLRALLEMASSDPRVRAHASLTLQRDNLAQLPEFMAEMRRSGIPVTFGVIRGSDFGTFDVPPDATSHIGPQDPDATEPTVDEIALGVATILREDTPGAPFLSLLQRRKLEAAVEILRGRNRGLACSAGYLEGVLYAEGDVALCELSRPVGNVRDRGHDFLAVWRSPEAHAMRRRLRRCSCTHGCNLTTMLRLDPQIFLSELAKGGHSAFLRRS